MKISTKGRYALRLLLDLAARRDEGYISLKKIAERQGISKQYLEQIISLFSSSKLLSTNRGKQGGYMLEKEPGEISVGEILRITEGNLAPVACLDGEVNNCERADSCLTLPIWQGLSNVISDYLDSITLEDILEES